MGLSVAALTVTFGRRAVLAEVSTAFAPGRVTVVLGANGAGKTTLLRAATGLLRPHGGRVTLDGVDIAGLSSRGRAQAIGYLPQDAAVHWNVAARDLVALGRLPHRAGAAADARAVATALAATGTAALADRRVRELSGGERARVLLARVLAGEARWILADEPLASLDPLHQLDTLALFRAAAARGVGVVLVLHDLTQAARIADDAVLLRDGRVLAAGPAQAVLTPAHLAAAYGVEVTITADAAGRPLIFPIRRALPI